MNFLKTFIDGEILNADDLNYLQNNIYITKTYQTFPTKEEILSLPNNSYFQVISTGNVTDCQKTICYVTTNWRENTLQYTNIQGQTIYVCPVRENANEVLITDFGIRPAYGTDGNDNNKDGIGDLKAINDTIAENNSNIIDNLHLAYGTTIRFPAGHFRFARPINWGVDKDENGNVIQSHGQYHIIGTHHTTFAHGAMSGGTWLHFSGLQDGDIALKTNQGTIKDLIIAGNPEEYTCQCNREKAKNPLTINQTFIETENPIKAYGLYSIGGASIENVMICDFYYGMYTPTSNTFISNVNFQRCHYGLIMDNDIKAFNISGATVMTLVQINGSISSISGCRGDSIGEHLIEITNGTSISLYDLDADFCMGSVICLGKNNRIASQVKHLVVNNIHGRHSVYHVSPSNEKPKGIEDITQDNALNFGIISVRDNCIFDGGIIITGQGEGSSPFDNAMAEWTTPTILLSAQDLAIVKNIQIITSLTPLEKNNLVEWGKNLIKLLNIQRNSHNIKLQTIYGNLSYTIPNTNEYIVQEELDNYAKKSNVVLSVNNIPPINGNVTITNTPPIIIEETVPEGTNPTDLIPEDALPSNRYVINGRLYVYQSTLIPEGTALFVNQLPKAQNCPEWTEKLPSDKGWLENYYLYSDTDQYGWQPVYKNKDEIQSEGIVMKHTPYCSGLIPLPEDINEIYISDWGTFRGLGYSMPHLVFYDKNKKEIGHPLTMDGTTSLNSIRSKGIKCGINFKEYDVINQSGYQRLSNIHIPVSLELCGMLDETTGEINKNTVPTNTEIKYFSFVFYNEADGQNLNLPNPEDIIVTVNEEIKYTTEDAYMGEWIDVGPYEEEENYAKLIEDLDSRVKELEQKLDALGQL